MKFQNRYNSLAAKLKPFFPAQIRTILRRKHQDYIFKKALKSFIDHYNNIENRVDILNDLIYGWGNMGWSAMQDYLIRILVETRNTKGPILECGSGLSTLLIGIIADKQNIKHYSLEHQEIWGNKVRTYLQGINVRNTEIFVSKMKNYHEFDWYEPPFEDLPEHFSLVVCDGPPGTTKGGRYGLLPIMIDRFSSKTLILFDDFSRQNEQDVVANWEKRYNLEVNVFGSNDVYATIVFK